MYVDNETLEEGSLEMMLVESKHFHNIPVNLTYSTIHVPTNVYNRGALIIRVITEKSHLDYDRKIALYELPYFKWNL